MFAPAAPAAVAPPAAAVPPAPAPPEPASTVPNAPAFVDVDVGTSDGSRVKFDKLELQVQASDAYRKPMLSLAGHQGCVGFRPSFSFKNNGWGDVRDASISVQFTGETPEDGSASRSFTKSIGGFSDGTDVFIGAGRLAAHLSRLRQGR